MESQHIGIDNSRRGGGGGYITFSDPHPRDDIHKFHSYTYPPFGLLAWLKFDIPTWQPSSTYTCSVCVPACCSRLAHGTCGMQARYDHQTRISVSTCCLVNKVIRPYYTYNSTASVLLLLLLLFTTGTLATPSPNCSDSSSSSSSSIFFRQPQICLLTTVASLICCCCCGCGYGITQKALRMGQLQWKLQYSSLVSRLDQVVALPAPCPYLYIYIYIYQVHRAL